MLSQIRHPAQDSVVPPLLSAFRLVHDQDLQEVTTTASRPITHPDDFVLATQWAIRHSLHPRAGATTVRVAQALAAKANRQGHVAYGRNRLASHLNLSISRLSDHIRYLRELGLLAWVEHGSRRNVRRTRNPEQHVDGYTATGTIYALCAPAAWDAAVGRRTTGAGYRARLVGVTGAGRRHESRLARLAKARTEAAGRRVGTARRRTPSCGGTSEVFEVSDDAGFKDTRAGARATAPTPSPTTTPHDLARTIEVARQLRIRVSWLRHARLRRLAYLLRPLILNQNHTVSSILQILAVWGSPTRVRRPLAYLANLLKRRAEAAPLPSDEACDGSCRRTSAPPFALLPAAATPALSEDRRHLDGANGAGDTQQLEALQAQYAFEALLGPWTPVPAATGSSLEQEDRVLGYGSAAWDQPNARSRVCTCAQDRAVAQAEAAGPTVDDSGRGYRRMVAQRGQRQTSVMGATRQLRARLRRSLTAKAITMTGSPCTVPAA
ncbi:hypothetical protein [Mangrovactinospora gilvigrisea]|uniref:hypothetical protein n=1 Tax=Mangrovactinospora gilvigrisea TaxID=1428644 RepID=UPI001114D030|nr:hypothetical protein [Mangrovactinospora gilvigrisea]